MSELPFTFNRRTTIAIQADPLEALKQQGDSTLVLADAALRAGARVAYYTPDTLAMDGAGCVSAHTRLLQQDASGLVTYGGDIVKNDMATYDVIVMRQDPPFDMRYITYTRMLERLEHTCAILNRPSSVAAFSEKMTATLFPQFTPPTIISACVADIIAFVTEHKRAVLKPLYDCAGQGIIKIDTADVSAEHTIRHYIEAQDTPCVAQAYIPDITETGDFRAIMINGEFAGGFSRMPPKGGFISNLAAGGHAYFRDRTHKEIEVCNTVGSFLKDQGLFLTGLDIVGGYLTEINVTSPTGLYQIKEHDSIDIGTRFWRDVEAVYL